MTRCCWTARTRTCAGPGRPPSTSSRPAPARPDLSASSGAGRPAGRVALRVPVEDGSLVDLAVVLDRAVNAAEVNDAFQAAATSGPLAGRLTYTARPVVSRDIVGDPSSCVFDSSLTEANSDLVKVFGWYDNEWGYSARLADLTTYVADRL